jgi:hypothetical protein
MSQANINVPNGSGAAFRAALNAALEALATDFTGATEPSPVLANQTWRDTSVSPAVV